jgi:hypothetical protein
MRLFRPLPFQGRSHRHHLAGAEEDAAGGKSVKLDDDTTRLDDAVMMYRKK